MDIEFLHDLFAVTIDGLRAPAEQVGDFNSGHTSTDHPQDLLFARGQCVQLGLDDRDFSAPLPRRVKTAALDLRTQDKLALPRDCS